MLKSGYEEYIHKSRYARYLPSEQRRESWNETVERYVNYFVDRGQIDGDTADELHGAILNCEVMPSMRAMMTAGKALDRDNVAGFNCSYLVVDHPRAFDELMYILMCGTGVGFSVERQYVSKLPEVAEKFHETDTVIHVADSKVGWAKSYRELISLLYSGQLPKWDVTRVRPAGATLKTFGGRASGPEPLAELFRFTAEVFRGAAGRRLTSLECHDLCCKVAQVVVVGGVRRSALISLSNLTDDRIRRAKHGQWWLDNPHRGLSNNSACYTEKPDFEAFLNEWSSLYESRSGERGFFSRVASQKQAAKNGRRDSTYDFGTNPCSEIILRPNQFCNLSEVVVRPEDTLEDLHRKVRIAAILGTLQATLTDFRYLRSVWKKNTEEEALLGVSLTGIMDHPFLSNKINYDVLAQLNDEFENVRGAEDYGVSICDEELNYMDAMFKAASFFGMADKEIKENDIYDVDYYAAETLANMPLSFILESLKLSAIETNKKWAKKLGINQSAAITCVKPSGTVSQLVDSASGIHARYAPYYIRRVRADMRDPLCKVLEDAGVPCETDVTSPTTKVFSFPKKAPEDAVFASEETGMSQLRLWDIYQKHWCEHKPSITVYYRDSEFLEIGQWMYNNFNDVSGVSFLPYSEHTYEQAPYEAIAEEKYEELTEGFPDEFEWDIMEQSDVTEASQTLACVGNNCEL